MLVELEKIVLFVGVIQHHQKLTSAQYQLWKKIEEIEEVEDTATVLLLLHALLRSAPRFLEGRIKARAIAEKFSSINRFSFLKRLFLIFEQKKIIGRAKQLLKKQKQEEALHLLELFLAKVPHDRIVHEALIQVALAFQDPLYEVAVLSLETLMKFFPNQFQFHFQLAELLLQQDEKGRFLDPKRAITIYQNILLLSPNNLQAKQGVKNASALFALEQF